MANKLTSSSQILASTSDELSFALSSTKQNIVLKTQNLDNGTQIFWKFVKDMRPTIINSYKSFDISYYLANTLNTITGSSEVTNDLLTIPLDFNFEKCNGSHKLELELYADNRQVALVKRQIDVVDYSVKIYMDGLNDTDSAHTKRWTSEGQSINVKLDTANYKISSKLKVDIIRIGAGNIQSGKNWFCTYADKDYYTSFYIEPQASGSEYFSITFPHDLDREGTFDYVLMLSAVEAGQNITYFISDIFSVYDKTIYCDIRHTYSFSDASTGSYNMCLEGGELKFIIDCATSDGTVLYWNLLSYEQNKLAPSGFFGPNNIEMNSDWVIDFNSNPVQGTVTINNSSANLAIPIAADLRVDGVKYYALAIYTDAERKRRIALSQKVKVLDSSIPPSYSVEGVPLTINEGSEISFKIKTSGLQDGTKVRWKIIPNTSFSTQTSDFEALTNETVIAEGETSIVKNLGTATFKTKADEQLEGTEYYKIAIYDVKDTQKIVNEYGPFRVLDTSRPALTYSVTSSSEITEGQNITFNIVTTNALNGEFLYWRVEGTGIAAIDIDPIKGKVAIQDNKASVTCLITDDGLVEVSEDARFCLYSDDSYSKALGEPFAFTIRDKLPEYSFLTSSQNSIRDEGKFFNVSLSVKNAVIKSGEKKTLYWRIVGDSITDADIKKLSGEILLIKTTMSFSIDVSILNDYTTEGTEKFKLQLYEDQEYSKLLAESNEMSITDTSVSATGTVTADKTTINEGDTVTFTVRTTGIAENASLWPVISGKLIEGSNSTVDKYDSSTPMSGIKVLNNTATLKYTPALDKLTEGNEQFSVDFYIDVDHTRLLATSETITINDTSQGITTQNTPKITVSADSNLVKEGDTLKISIFAPGIPDNTNFVIKVGNDASSLSESDWADMTYSDQSAFKDGLKYVFLKIKKDVLTEGTETFVVGASTTINSVQYDGVSLPITIADTSVSAADALKPTLFISSANSVREGASSTFKFNTTNVPNGSVANWSLKADNLDLTNDTNRTQGKVLIVNNAATVNVAITADSLTEGNETFYMEVDVTDENNTSIVSGKSAIVSIEDTSKTLPYVVTVDKEKANEGDTVTFTITADSDPDGTRVWWKIYGLNSTLNVSDFNLTKLTGVGVLENKKIILPVQITKDMKTENSEGFLLQVYPNETLAQVSMLAKSPTVYIDDTSKELKLTVTSDKVTVKEGESFKLTIKSTFAVENYKLYWKTVLVNYNVDASDFLTPFSGELIMNGSVATLQIDVAADQKTESVDEFRIFFSDKENDSSPIATSPTIKILDTSKKPLICTFVPDKTEVNEGDSVKITVSTTDVKDGTEIFWKFIGSTNEKDFVGVPKGSLKFKNSQIVVERKITSDFLSEGVESFYLELFYDRDYTQSAAKSEPIKINDTSISYSFDTRSFIAKENTNAIVSCTISNVSVPKNGTVPFYWKIEGTNVDADDVNTLTGTFVVKTSAATKFNIPLTFKLNDALESDEKFRVVLYKDAELTQKLIESEEYTIANIIPETAGVFAQSTTVNEGEELNFILKMNVQDGTRVYPVIVPATSTTGNKFNITVQDFETVMIDLYSESTIGIPLNSVKVIDQTCKFKLTLRNDGKNEGEERFNVYVFTSDSYVADANTLISETITITDTSIS